ncbi:MAG: potassium transporter TrkG [Pseudomonadota bacterium]
MLPWRRFPLFVHMTALMGAAMWAPMLHAAYLGDWATGRLFLYLSCLTLTGCVVVGLALANRAERMTARGQLVTLVASLVMVPMLLAVPFPLRMPATAWSAAYFEMVSAITTTGATIYTEPQALPPSLHLWRGIVGWLGGYLTLIAAFAVMAPLDIGGFEITRAVHGRTAATTRALERGVDLQLRLFRVISTITRPYLALTLLLIVAMLIAGMDGLTAVMTGMAVLSTSGIVASAGFVAEQGGFLAEVLIAAFLVVSTTALVYDPSRRRSLPRISADPELRLVTALLIVIPGVLMLRHFIGVLELEAMSGVVPGLQALWGALFTVLSAIATFGHESLFWDTAQDWSGLATPGLLLLALAAMGGGVASTAGGVKLLRIYALYKHGVREMERLTLPNSLGGSGATQRRIRREGAFIAWVFLMLFLLSIATTMIVLSLFGIALVDGLTLGILMLANAGAGLDLISDTTLRISDLGSGAQLTLAAAMIVGRLEVLAVIALFHPVFWRR